MGKNVKIIFIFMIIIVLISCSPHTHEYTVKYDEKQHYKECICGYVIDQNNHILKEEIVQACSCTEKGIKVFECSECDYKKEVQIEMLDHDCVETIVKEPSCIEEGLMVRKCNNCNYYEEEIIEKIDHNYLLKHNEKYHYRECECGEIIDLCEHNYEWIVDVDSTDLLVGYKHQECNECKFIINELTEIEIKCSYDQINDDDIINSIIHTKLNYSSNYWFMGCDYTYLWDGVSSKIKEALLQNEIDKEDYSRGYTYLVEYFETNNDYYLVYMEKPFIQENYNVIDEIANKGIVPHFYETYLISQSNEFKKIDGKYLLLLSQNDYLNYNVKVFKTDNLENVKLYLDNYQLVLCAESKNVLVKENVSNNEKIDLEKLMFKRKLIEIGDNDYYLSDYTYEFNNDLEMIDEDVFDYVGETLEYHHGAKFIDNKYYSFPIDNNSAFYFGFESAEIVLIENERYVLLPRYTKACTDLLEENEYEESGRNVMVFGDYKEAFKEAFYKVTDRIICGYIMGLYKYEDVKHIVNSDWYDGYVNNQANESSDMGN